MGVNRDWRGGVPGGAALGQALEVPSNPGLKRALWLRVEKVWVMESRVGVGRLAVLFSF